MGKTGGTGGTGGRGVFFVWILGSWTFVFLTIGRGGGAGGIEGRTKVGENTSYGDTILQMHTKLY